jgi:hypothetical protein
MCIPKSGVECYWEAPADKKKRYDRTDKGNCINGRACNIINKILLKWSYKEIKKHEMTCMTHMTNIEIGRKEVIFKCHPSTIGYLLTYSMEQSPFEKLTGSATSQEILHIFGTRRFITVFTSACHLSLS